jgi:tRNA nucleotidyltransferase/poly(A) polymerase
MEPIVRNVLTALNDAGFEAYIVGGAVRDMLMGRTPHDYDVTTSARPEDIKTVAAAQDWHTVEIKGECFGIVVLVVAGMTIETATFRGEAYGSDSHRPEQVWYAKTLREDVMRRDFTVNAMAMDREGHIYDYIGGQKDIRKKRLATVGDAALRFHEDALRLFRACRFTGQLDFQPAKDLLRAMPAAFPRVSGLSLNRVVQEMDKLMVAPAAFKGLDVLVRSGLGDCSCRQKENGQYTAVPILPECSHLPDTPQSRPFHLFDAWFHTLAVVAHTPPDLTIRYAAFFHDIAKGLPGIRGVHHGRYTDYGHDEKGAEIAKAILLRWHKGPALASRVAWLVKTHMKFHYFANTGQGDVDKWLRREALEGPFRRTTELVEAVRQATAVAKGDALGCGYDTADTEGTESFGAYMAVLASQMPVSTKDLFYDKRIPDQCARQTGRCLQVLLKRVQNKELQNDADILAEAAGKWMKRHDGALTDDRR